MNNASPGQDVQLIVLDCVDCARNMARYYVLAIEPTLFDEISLVREWGRIGKRGAAGPTYIRVAKRRGSRWMSGSPGRGNEATLFVSVNVARLTRSQYEPAVLLRQALDVLVSILLVAMQVGGQ